MIDHRLLYILCPVIGIVAQAISPKIWKFLHPEYEPFVFDNIWWGVKIWSRVKGFEKLARMLNSRSEARKGMRELLPPHRKEPRKYTVAVMWLPWMLDLEMRFDSYAEAKVYAIQLKAEYPNNFFFVKWEKNTLRKAGNIYWNLNDLRNRLSYDHELGNEVFHRERWNQ